MVTDDRNAALALATSYSELRSSGAFRDLMGYLDGEVLRAEGEAILTPAEMPTQEVRQRIMAWQERKKVVMGIQSLLEDQTEIKRSIEEEIENERAINRERASRTGW